MGSDSTEPTDALPTETARPQARFSMVCTGYGLGAVCMPILVLGTPPTLRELVTTAAAISLAALLTAIFRRYVATGLLLGTLGVGLVALAAVLYTVTPAGLATAIIALILGAGVGLAAGAPLGWGERTQFDWIAGLIAAALTILGLQWFAPEARWTLWVAVAISAVPVVARAVSRLGNRDAPAAAQSRHKLQRLLLGLAVCGALALMAWTAANDPQLSWFGPVVSNGDRAQGQVALTFDDGPNDPYSLQVAQILESRGLRGTFFMVGKAVDAHPEVARELAQRGHLVGNHSYHHDYWRWLDPRYPELDRTQRAISTQVGLCPRFYRPPHGQRTPFISAQVARDGMQTITWDVSAGDWSTTDGALVARRILRRVHPGSIILLHDGLDGISSANRQVVVDALPVILDGLAERGLKPVRVDRLLGTKSYLTTC